MSFVAGEQIGRVVGGRFRLEALVGRGATAEVYLAVDTRLRRRVAVKVLHPGMAGDPQFVRRFRSEAQLASRLTHPNILVIHDWHDGTADERADGAKVDEPAYLITEFLDGGSLRAMLDDHRRLSLSQVALVGIEAARALAYAHGQGIVHRDIKPANLLFAADGSLRIGDFGLARAIAEAALTEPNGSLVGTARYSAPEQATGATLDGRADVYALAVTLIEAATGEAPFRADTPIGVLMARQAEPLVPPESMGVLAEALLPAGTVSPDDRIDAAELLRRLERCTRSLPRPERLPLVTTKGLRSFVDDDPTIHRSSGPRPAGVLSDTASILEDHPDVGRGAPAAVGEPIIDSRGPQLRDVADSDLRADEPTSRAVDPLPTDESPRAYDVSLADDDPATGDDLPGDGRSSRRTVVVGGIALLAAGGGTAFGVKRYLDGRPVYRVVPIVVGLDLGVARTAVEDTQLVWSQTTAPDETVPSGQVISQTPSAGQRVLRASGVRGVVSSGPQPRPVPALVGLTEADAAAAAQAVQLTVHVRERPFDEQVPEGQVINSSPESGELPRGSAVEVDVSAGPAPRQVPNMSGMTPEQAMAALPDGLLGVIVQQPSDTVAAGIVIAANYKPTTKLPKGSTVKIIVSTGPPLMTVPATKGLDVLAASQVLRDAGLVVEGVEGSPDQPVLGSRPAANQQVKRGTTVMVITGPQ